MTAARASLIKKVLVSVLVFAMVLAGSWFVWLNRDNESGASLSGWNTANIMSDHVMTNKNSMTEAQIQAFLKSKNPCNNTNIHMASWYPNTSYTIRDGHFVCMADDTFGGETAAHIIWQAAQDYGINPQVLIVLLEKEQGLVSDTWPNSVQYKSATGYGCPDSAPCDSQYYGLKNQVRNAARFFRAYQDNTSGWYKPYWVGNYSISFHPDSSRGCGSTVVNIQNRATASLYSYTPYQPNQAALNAGYGTGDNCSSYGNRNFYNLFTDWFGSTGLTVKGSIGERYQLVKNQLGAPIANEIYAGNDTWWQEFENGFIVGTGSTGFWESKGAIRERWSSLGFQSGRMGWPTGPENYNSSKKSWSQTYQHGMLVGSNKFWIIKGSIGEYWVTRGSENGSLGLPKADEIYAGNDTWWQEFENGFIVGTGSTGFWESKGAIRTYWESIGYQNGKAGWPTGAERYDPATKTWSQVYKKGTIYYSDSEGGWFVAK